MLGLTKSDTVSDIEEFKIGYGYKDTVGSSIGFIRYPKKLREVSVDY